MELWARLIVRKHAVFTFWLITLCGSTAFCQNSRLRPEDIELFPKPGFELDPPHKSTIRDNSNIKPENFRFADKSGKSLEYRLSAGTGAEPPDCIPSWGLFRFSVNGRGLIDTTWFDGKLPAEVSKRILNNIRSTEGSWMVVPGTKPNDVAWYVYFYSDTRGRWNKNMRCPESDKELQKVVSSMTSLFYNSFYFLGEDKATMVRPTSNDGTPKI